MYRIIMNYRNNLSIIKGSVVSTNFWVPALVLEVVTVNSDGLTESLQLVSEEF